MAFSYITILLINSLTFPFFWQIFQYPDFSRFSRLMANLQIHKQMGWLRWPHICHSWQRVPNPPILWRPPFQILSNLHPFLLLPTLLHPHCSFRCLVLFGWVGDRAIFDVLFYLMISWIYKCWALVPEGPWCVFYTKMHQLYWGTLVLWFDVTHTHTHTRNILQRLVDWHTIC